MNRKFYILLASSLLSFTTSVKAETIQIHTEISVEELKSVDLYLNNFPSMCDYITDFVSSGRYQIPLSSGKFATNHIESLFIKIDRASDETIVYRFGIADNNLVFTNGFSYTKNSIQNREIYLIRKENHPKYYSIKTEQIFRLTMSGYDEKDKRITHKLICPASIRSLNNEYIDVNIESNPNGAKLAIDGKVLNFTTNQLIRIPKSNEAITITLLKDGFIPHIEQISESSKINVDLIPASP